MSETEQLIVAFIKRTWASSMSSDIVASDVATILLIGGGAYCFEQDMRRLFKKRLQIPEAPEYANAIGNAKLARHYLQRNKTS